MKVGIVVFPGSNCDQDAKWAFSNMFQQEVEMLWHKDTDLKNCELIFLPGGFSYGDYLRSGAIARFSPIMQTVIEHAQGGGLVMGVCNGFQILCESHLLPGALLHNRDQKFHCNNVFIRTETTNTLLTSASNKGQVLKIPIAHGEGKFYCNEETYQSLLINDQILFRYCSETGEVNDASNPNGSMDHIAGICNAGRNVFGMMPHPERVVDPEIYNTDGRVLFEGLLSAAMKA